MSFHPSGQFKRSTKIGRPGSSIDRCTVTGVQLKDIYEPRIMLMIFLPNLKTLGIRVEQLGDTDVVIDTASFPLGPLRCAVSCVAKEWYEAKSKEHIEWFGPSTHEETIYVEMPLAKRVWAFTLYHSKNDKHTPSAYKVFLFGDPSSMLG